MSGDIYTQIINSKTNKVRQEPWWIREEKLFRSIAKDCPSHLAENNCNINREPMRCNKDECPFWYWKQFLK